MPYRGAQLEPRRREDRLAHTSIRDAQVEALDAIERKPDADVRSRRRVDFLNVLADFAQLRLLNAPLDAPCLTQVVRTIQRGRDDGRADQLAAGATRASRHAGR